MSDPINIRPSATIHTLPTREGSENTIGFDGGDGGGDDGSMNERVATLEAKWEAVIPTLATKSDIEGTKTSIAEVRTDVAGVRADVARGFADQTKWIIGAAFGGVATFIVVMTFVLNNAVPKAPAAAAQQPIIINVPGAAVPPAPAASRP
jgi:hypothetical protein